MTLGEFIKNRRKELGITRNLLATKAGISHTEVQRIETNERKQPSLKVLCALADSLSVSQEEMLKIAGYTPSDGMSATQRAFPGLVTQKQQETVKKIADGISRNANLKDEDLDAIYNQVEMIINYVMGKRNS